MISAPRLDALPLEAFRAVVLRGSTDAASSPLFPVTNLCGVSRALRERCARLFAQPDFWRTYTCAVFPLLSGDMVVAPDADVTPAEWRALLKRAALACLRVRFVREHTLRLCVPLNTSVFDATASPIDTAREVFTYRDCHVPYAVRNHTPTHVVCSTQKVYYRTVPPAPPAPPALRAGGDRDVHKFHKAGTPDVLSQFGPSFTLNTVWPRLQSACVPTQQHGVYVELSDEFRARIIAYGVPPRLYVALCFRLDEIVLTRAALAMMPSWLTLAWRRRRSIVP